ncbi:MAG: methionine--tRNA ligase, partial [bacterium]
MTKYLVTAALPYANGPVHLGHIAGAYLPADIYVRYLKMKGEDAVFICGSDEHGVPVTIKAEQQGKSPQEIVDYYHNMMKESFRKFGIIFDNYSRTSKPAHHENARHFFKRLHENGYLENKTQQQYYCEKCSRFLPDRYVEGECPHCHFDNARGDQCDNCGKVVDNVTLINPKCKLCGSVPVVRETEHFYLKLNEFSDRLKDWLKSKDHWKSNVREFALGWVKEGLQPRAITRDLNWGVEIPLEDYENKVLYVWFDAPIGYISSTMEWAEKTGDPGKWKDYWKNDDCRLIHFLGKDNIVFHSVIWPSMLMGVDEGYVLPDNIPANEYLNIEGKKLSTSRNTAVWLDDYLENYNPDIMRYALCVNFPETKDADFSWKELRTRNNSELADIMGNFINRTVVFIRKYMDGELSDNIELNDTDRNFIDILNKKIEHTGELIENYKLRQAGNSMMDIAREANKYFTVTEPWEVRKTDKERLNTILYVCLKAVSVLAIASEPFMPFTAEKLRNYLGIERPLWGDMKDIEPPLKLREEMLEILFEKIEEEEMKMPESKDAKENSGSENLVNIKDFFKSELVIAKVLSAQKVEKADRLLKLRIDVGDGERTIVAGIAEYYDLEDIEGRNIVVVKNLEPATIMGVKSQGMLLAGSNKKEKRLKVLFADDSLEPG